MHRERERGETWNVGRKSNILKPKIFYFEFSCSLYTSSTQNMHKYISVLWQINVLCAIILDLPGRYFLFFFVLLSCVRCTLFSRAERHYARSLFLIYVRSLLFFAPRFSYTSRWIIPVLLAWTPLFYHFSCTRIVTPECTRRIGESITRDKCTIMWYKQGTYVVNAFNKS